MPTDEQIKFSVYIENLVARYKNGETECAYEIYESLSNVFKKYYKILHNNKYNLKNKDTCKFLKMLIGSNVELNKLNQTFVDRLMHINLTFQQQEFDDFKQECWLILLSMLNRYKKVHAGFFGYFSSSIKYEMYRYVFKAISEQGVWNYKIDNIDDVNLNNQYYSYEDCYENKDQEIYLLNNFSKYEKDVLCAYYLNNYNDKQISLIFNKHINTINTNRRKFVEKLAEKKKLTLSDAKRKRITGRNNNFQNIAKKA